MKAFLNMSNRTSDPLREALDALGTANRRKPQTKAGQRLRSLTHHLPGSHKGYGWDVLIADIEDEARAAGQVCDICKRPSGHKTHRPGMFYHHTFVSEPVAETGLRQALIPLATMMADHLFHPEGHAPDPTAAEGGDSCWTDLYRAIVGLDHPERPEMLTIVCPACEETGEVMSGYYEPEPVKCWTCDGKGTLTGRPATPFDTEVEHDA